MVLLLFSCTFTFWLFSHCIQDCTFLFHPLFLLMSSSFSLSTFQCLPILTLILVSWLFLFWFVFKFVWMSWSYYPWSPFPWHSPTFPLFFLFTTLISISISIIFLFLIVMYLMFVLYSISSPSSFFFHFVPFICTIHLFVFFKFMDHAHSFCLFIWDSWYLILEFYCCLCYIFVHSQIVFFFIYLFRSLLMFIKSVYSLSSPLVLFCNLMVFIVSWFAFWQSIFS